jgi:hypothetical protein
VESGVDFFLREHLKASPDSVARMAFFLDRDGVSQKKIAQQLDVPVADVPCLIATGRTLVPARRRLFSGENR